MGEVMEQFVLKFLALGEPAIPLFSYALILIGALISFATDKQRYHVQRIPYFAESAFILTGVSLSQGVWLFASDAIQAGYVWLVAVLSSVSLIIGGYFFAKVAAARSRDAFGHSRRAFYFLIPFANLILLFAASSDNSIGKKYGLPILQGRSGVAIGFLFIFFYGAQNATFIRGETTTEATAPNSAMTGYDAIAEMLETNGIQKTLDILANAAALPHQVDSETTLTSIVSVENELIRTYLVSDAVPLFDEDLNALIIARICGNDIFSLIMQSGGKFHELYKYASGEILADILVGRDSCFPEYPN